VLLFLPTISAAFNEAVMRTSRPVVVKRLPKCLHTHAAKKFLREAEPFLRSDQPHLVFDLSQVEQMDAAGVDMLIYCLTEALRRDGDLKLASLSPEAAIVLEVTRAEQLFELFLSSADAVRSYGVVSLHSTIKLPDTNFVDVSPLPFRKTRLAERTSDQAEDIKRVA
jgi:anti-anti-sigma factor